MKREESRSTSKVRKSQRAPNQASIPCGSFHPARICKRPDKREINQRNFGTADVHSPGLFLFATQPPQQQAAIQRAEEAGEGAASARGRRDAGTVEGVAVCSSGRTIPFSQSAQPGPSGACAARLAEARELALTDVIEKNTGARSSARARAKV